MNSLRGAQDDANARMLLGEALRVMFANAARFAASDADQSVHSARKEMKRIRAALRLLRAALGNRIYHVTNAMVRDASSPLTSVRDALVLLQTLRSLDVPTRHAPDRTSAKKLLKTLQNQYNKECRALTTARKAPIPELLQRCMAVLEISFGPLDAKALQQGMQSMYRAGRQAHRRARRHRSIESFHDWRKHVKYLYYASQLMSQALPVRVRRIRRRSKKLADLLGADHDLALLKGVLEKGGCRPSDSLMILIKRKRRHLQSKALRRGKRFFAKSPRRFVATLSPA